MGSNSREKNMRSNPRARSSSSSSSAANPGLDLDNPISKSIAESGMQPLNYDSSLQNPNPNNCYDQTGSGYCTEEQLEEFLMLKLEFVYNEAISKLVGLGYSESASLKAVLSNGHCYGGKDLLGNILSNSIKALNSCNDDQKEPKTVFCDLKQLEKYALTGLVCLLQQLRPNLSKGYALWCLLMSDLHIGRAAAIKIPVPGHGYPVAVPADLASAAAAVTSAAAAAALGGRRSNSAGGMIAPCQSQFHGRWQVAGSGSSSGGGSGEAPEMNFQLQREIEIPKRFGLTPSMMSALKRNVAMFAAGCRANSKQLQPLTKGISGSSSTVSNLAFPAVPVMPNEKSGVGQCLDDQDIIKDLVSKLFDLSLNEMGLVTEDQKNQVIINLLHQIKDLEKQVVERREWAQEKALQAARKLTSDMTELKTLRMAREEIQRLKQGKQPLDDSTMKKLSEKENALRCASVELDRANAVARKLEQENAEIRAEMEASKLSASETVIACKEVAKREKKLLKKLQAWEKQKAKMQKEITDEKEKIMQTEEELDQIRQIKKEAEIKWKEELKAKENAIGLVEEERRSKEADESNNKRKIEALRVKIEIDFQRYEDDVRRLEQELSCLQAAAKSAELQLNASPESGSEGPKTETVAKLLEELDNLEDFSEKDEVNGGRECIICKKDEVSIVFLPCAHQVICASCGDLYGKYGQAACPCCRVPIEQRIRVFGASS
ncbi:PREDICTED: MND1-interacting protein 1-like isoform X2 [Lupinus angustifolius]|uniref:MND1-interacting protein 1-like isoform X2 n=1 Tax=Lupinus angustifolius TaxID=3871 RepID=UPI00092F0120|nr:PREDICTED: MND1-interacting protein 1-like isoform X2 [Lupinus angustifolius]